MIRPVRQAATRGTVQYRYVPPKTPPSPGPATRSPGGPLRGRSAAPPGQPGVHPPQSYFSASTTGKNQYVRPRAPCTSAPPHADGGKWGGLDRDVVSRTAAARCLGSSEGRPARPKFVSQRKRTTDPDGLPSPPRARAALVRTGWPETAVGPPAAPRPRRICTSGAAPAHAGARSSAPGGSLPVVPRGGRSRRAAWTGGPSRRRGARLTLQGGRAPGGVAGAAAGLPRGRPARAPRRRAARRGRPGPFHFSKGARLLCAFPIQNTPIFSPYKTLLYFLKVSRRAAADKTGTEK